jgi:alpha-N-arabinofuranosidase
MQIPERITNPILPGFYPDPSICRVGDDFFLVNSTFAYFPGIPVFTSRDLAHWRQIGNVLDRAEQLDLDGARTSRGLFAPSIRWHDGWFYVLCTNVDNGGNFIVSARDPAGPWSNPVWLTDAPGIDPSMFFDDDGRVWYVGNRPVSPEPAYFGNWEIWIREFDFSALRAELDRVSAPGTAVSASKESASGRSWFLGDSIPLWRGALRDAVWPEGPRLYKKDGCYYLMIAEGGTGPDHAVTIARAEKLAGPWVGKLSNPILTHRHLGLDAAIVNVGHADLVDDGRGNWWMVLLAQRPYGGRFSNLGRETFIVPVVWEEGWPRPCPGTGLVEFSYPAPFSPSGREPLSPVDAVAIPACEHFDTPALPPHWLTLRTPRERAFSLDARPGWLRLYARAPGLRGVEQVSFAGRRQQHMSWRVSALFDFSPAVSETAGIAILQSENHQLRLEIACSPDAPDSRAVRLVRAAGGPDEVVSSVNLAASSGSLCLYVVARGQSLSFFAGAPGSSPIAVAADVDGSILSTEVAGGFVGTIIGAFASGNGIDNGNFADVDWFEYQGN